MRAKAILLLSLAILTSVAVVSVPLNLWAGTLSEQALEYRAKGHQAQRSGDIATAIKYYQKAVALNPNYAAPYNDLGVVYEGRGWLGRAEWAYLKALEIDPNYADVYSNLALLSERKNEIKKAVFYWKKRIRFGDPDDLWTQKAWRKLAEYISAEEIERLKVLLAQEYYLQADSLFEKGTFDKALKWIDRAVRLTPEDRKIINLKKKIEVKLNENKIAEKITTHYAQGMKYYYSGDYLNAGEEFKKMLEFLPAED